VCVSEEHIASVIRARVPQKQQTSRELADIEVDVGTVPTETNYIPPAIFSV
jgi:hypothetical protein